MSYIADHIMASLLDRVHIFLLLITYNVRGLVTGTTLSQKNHTSNHCLVSNPSSACNSRRLYALFVSIARLRQL
jgi:hypothetical protein